MGRGKSVAVDGESLTVDDVCSVARGEARPRLPRSVGPRMARSRRVVADALASDRATYGVNTGFGHLARVRIPQDQIELLQLNLVRSHAAGIGPPVDEPTVRALLLLRANVLARGHSGCRAEVVRMLLSLLERDVLPVVPERGSVGASGDLAPLAHVALTLIGEGEAFFGGRRMPSARALRRAGLEPLHLEAKEGIALINGTQFAVAIGCLALERAHNALKAADAIAALSIDALRGTWRSFDPRIHAARPHPGQSVSAGNMRRLMRGSGVLESHVDCDAVQDAYSMRCAPQVHGAARDAIAELDRVLSIEINSSTDNPMVFADDGETISGGNFHGAPLAAALDYASLALTTVSGIVERRTDRLVNPLVSGLPAFLAGNPGLESGLMMAQVTSASLVSECKTLAHPGSVDSIPTSALQEDHVSMAPWCARKLREIVERLEALLAIELLAATVGLGHLRPLRSSRALEAVVGGVGRTVRLPEGDFPPGPVIERLAEAVRDGSVPRWCAAGGVRLR